jgi:RimJ/RimL family protein N-acetyltransferase
MDCDVRQTPQIATERLILTPLVPGDAVELFAYRSDPEVCRYQSWAPESLADAQRFIENLQPVAFETPGTWFQFGIRLRNLRLLIGDLGVHFPVDVPRQAEIGFTLAPAHQGRGLATEAVGGLLDHLFASVHLHRVYASVDPKNLRSIGLLRRIGMRREARFRESVWFRGGWADDVVFAILDSEWKER